MFTQSYLLYLTDEEQRPQLLTHNLSFPVPHKDGDVYVFVLYLKYHDKYKPALKRISPGN